MSYLQIYENRINKFFIPEEMASVIVLHDKRSVNHGKWSLNFGLKFFNLELRGLRPVMRTLLDRVPARINVPIQTKDKKWVLPVEQRIREMKLVVKDSFEKAKVMALGYLECVELLGGPKAGWVEYQRQVGFFFHLAAADEMEDFLKYQTASLCALTLSNPCDEMPDVVQRGNWRVGEFLPYCVRVQSWLRRQCIKNRSERGVQISFSIYQTKQISPAVSESFVQKNMDKNLKALTTERDLPDKIKLKDAVERTVDELYHYATHPQRPTYDVPRSLCHQRNRELRSRRLQCNPRHLKIPSLAACYENTRTHGGALNHLRCFQDCYYSPFDISRRIFLGYATRKDKFFHPIPIYGLLDEEDQERLMRPSLDGRGQRVMVRREPILEPFKVRVISKGEAVPYQRAQNFQPFLWSILQLADCFELTGRPLEDEDLEAVLNFGKSSGQHCQIVSGDYAAATDNLHPWLCTVALRRICFNWGIPFEDSLNMLSCLVGHLIDDRFGVEYKSDPATGRDFDVLNFDPDGKIYEQIWGQLMGSPVSFPILCIINAAVTRDAMEKAWEQGSISLRDKAFLVNGDDVIFTMPSAGYQIWVNTVTSAGLSPSVGKNFVSRRYGVINSQVYDCGSCWDYYHHTSYVKKVPLVKMNLVHCGQHETTERRKDANLIIGESLRHGKTLEGRMWELVKGFSGEIRDRLLKRAYTYAAPHLMKLPPVSWVLPKCLGGLGLPPTSDHMVSDHHLKIATMILCLDDDTRKDMVRLQWLKEPGKVFCEITNSQITEYNEQLDNRIVLRTSKTEDGLFGRLVKSNLGFGVDEEVLDNSRVIGIWERMYWSWYKKSLSIRWILPDDNTLESAFSSFWNLVEGKKEAGLHMVSADKALSLLNQYWTYESPIVWK